MKNIKFLQQLDFHDSLLEEVSYDKKSKTLNIKIDFCLWMQKGYDESMPETKIILLEFGDVAEFESPGVALDSDEIISAEFTPVDDNKFVAKLIMVNDPSNLTYAIEFKAESVQLF